MATVEERLAALEADKKWHWWALGGASVGALGWLLYLTTTLNGISVSIGKIEQKIADGGTGTIVQQLEHPTSPQQLAANLSLVSSQIALARANKKPPKLEKLEPLATGVQQAAEASPSLPEVWQAAFSLITYRSELNPNQGKLELPNCLTDESSATSKFYLLGPHLTPKMEGYPVYKATSCVFDLDFRPDFDQTIAGKYWKSLATKNPGVGRNYEIADSVITYSGGAMIPIDTLKFRNCTFVFKSSGEVPPAKGQSLTKQLLASSLTSDTLALPAGM